MLIDYQASFLDEAQEHFESLDRHGLLSNLKADAWEKFLQVGLPDRKSEAFRYFPLNKFYERPYHAPTEALVYPEDIAKAACPDCQGALIVYVNGQYQPKLSQLDALEGACSVLCIEDALRSYGSFIQAKIAESIKQESSSFALLNVALHQNAAFVYVPKKMELIQPIQVLHFVTPCSEGAFLNPRLHLFAGAESHVKLSVKHVAAQDAHCVCNSAIDMQLDSGANVEYEELTLDAEKSYVFSTFRADLKEKADLKAIHLTEGSMGVHIDEHVMLKGEYASCFLGGLGLLKGTCAQAKVFVEHFEENCSSSQLFKNILKASADQDVLHGAKASFEGEIYVHSKAQKTDAFQLSNNLIMDDASTAYARPNLEIFADDVKASHGATTAQIDKEALFYLQSRGVSKAKAKELLSKAFCLEVVKKLFSPTMKKEALRRIERYAEGL
jgi:Fe-S cluster assembly protein SufD